jgi:two-component system, probable response regulator PhcQ
MSGSFKILVVDDDPEMLGILGRLLRQEGYRIVAARDAEEASARLRREPFDVILSDHAMPGMNGVDLLRWAKLLHPGAMRILLTGQPDLAMAIEAINRGEVYRFMTKPFNPHELRLNVRLACRQLELSRENERLVAEVRKRDGVLDRLESKHPGITRIRRAPDGTILIDEEMGA